MTTPRPPAVATWLLSRLVIGEPRESLIGDLVEQHQRGRSSAWCWRQALSTIATSFAAELWEHKVLAIIVAVLSVYLIDIYNFLRVPVWVFRVDQLWYPRLIYTRWSWLVINPWAYRLQPYWLTFRVAWCLLVGSLSWVLPRLNPRQRGLVVTLLLVTQLGQFAPFVWGGLMNCLRQSVTPIEFWGSVWYSIFASVAMPVGIITGGGWGAGGNKREVQIVG